MLKSLLVEGEWISSTFGDGNPRELTIQLPRSSTLRVSFAETTSLPVYTVSSERRALQEALAERIKQYDSQAQLQDEQYPVTFVYTALKEYIDDLPEDNTSIVEGVASDKTPTPRKPIRTKCILFWAHHLLATSKRKDIHKFSLELHLWSLAKIGYPGVIVAQGLADDVDEFLRRIKVSAVQSSHKDPIPTTPSGHAVVCPASAARGGYGTRRQRRGSHPHNTMCTPSGGGSRTQSASQ